MDKELIYRIVFTLCAIALMAVRISYQSRTLKDRRRIEVREDPLSLTCASLAALISIIFGLEYILFPGTFAFTYALAFPDALRVAGGLLLVGGVSLLGMAHHHLGLSFHSLVVKKEGQALVETGPYRWIRHPIYTAYLAGYLGGGLLAGSLVLAAVPVCLYAVLVASRMKKEEEVLLELFGRQYRDYQARSGRLLPRWRKCD